jgi:hypothetical protein
MRIGDADLRGLPWIPAFVREGWTNFYCPHGLANGSPCGQQKFVQPVTSAKIRVQWFFSVMLPPAKQSKSSRDIASSNSSSETRASEALKALGKVMQHLLKDDTQVYKQFVENESFRRFVGDMAYPITNEENAPGAQ